jgi:hypothetical protein
MAFEAFIWLGGEEFTGPLMAFAALSLLVGCDLSSYRDNVTIRSGAMCTPIE